MPSPVDNRDFLGKVGARRTAILGILGAEVRQSRGVYNKYLPIGVQVVGCVLFVEMWISNVNRAAYGRRNPDSGMNRARLCLGLGVKNVPVLGCYLTDRLAPGARDRGKVSRCEASPAASPLRCFKDRFSLAETYAYAGAECNIACGTAEVNDHEAIAGSRDG